MSKKFLLAVFLVICTCSLTITDAHALTADQIAEKVYLRDNGKTGLGQAQMILTNKKGENIVREFQELRKEYDNGLEKTMMRFSSPADIKDVAFLSWEVEKKDDIQFIYLPELGRPRRISGENKSNSFINSDFTYEDMQRRKPEDDDHSLLMEETKNGINCYVVEYTPKTSSQYSKIIQWIDKEKFISIYSEAYDKKDELLKIFQAEKIEKVDGIWTLMEINVQNVKKDHKTTLITEKIQYNVPIDDAIFTKENLSLY